jgi:hypothetical protein
MVVFLFFIFIGRAMADEACTTFSSVITDMTSGHKFISDIFGEHSLPKVKLNQIIKVYVVN